MRLTSKRGSTIVEVTMAMAVLAVLLMAVAQSLVGMIVQGRASQRQQLALQEAANVMERMMVRQYDEVTAATAQGMQLSPEAKVGLPSAELHVIVSEEGENARAKRVEVEVAWRDHGGQQHAPARLVAWKYPRESAE